MHPEQIVELAKSNEIANRFFEDLAQREKNYRATSVERARAITGGKRSDVIDLFRDMERVGLGDFVIGRRGGKSRFEWKVGMVDAGRVATGESSTVADIGESEYEVDTTVEIEDVDDGGDLISHSFMLRKGRDPVVFSLPEDLTQLEARRLSAFISSLPFEAEA